MTRKEFNQSVTSQFETMKEAAIRNHTKEELFRDSYSNAKLRSIYEFLVEYDGNEALIEELYPEHSVILGLLFQYEWNYELPMWAEWEQLAYMLADYVNDKREAQKQKGE